jgi:hypothetical protein
MLPSAGLARVVGLFGGTKAPAADRTQMICLYTGEQFCGSKPSYPAKSLPSSSGSKSEK